MEKRSAYRRAITAGPFDRRRRHVQVGIERIRYVTEHFRELQGLRVLPIGVMVLVLAAGRSPWAFEGDWTGPEDNILWLLLFGGVFLTYWLIARHYRRHYGKVEAAGDWEKTLPRTIGFVVLIMAGLAVDIYLDPPFKAFLLALCLPMVGKGILDPRRWPYAALGLALSVLAFWELLPFDREHAGWLFAALLGVGFIVIGIYDHLLLRRMLAKEVAADG